ncbi:hypothetical protein [uncultured Meiothermus sp.]|jgi:hypothetical protein|uniref:hypothetical protein n=1 Tax=uncultured Meiothermus sp. TaxID=157471 RepID=UPI00260A6770|nr:hypothetical protein [uncultured Meiothermus sp.]
MRNPKLSSLVAVLSFSFLVGCSEPQLPSAQAALVLELSRQTTLDAAGAGLAGYFCRRVICAGDDSQNNPVRGLLEFDLEALPAGITGDRIAGATLRIYQGESSTTYAQLQNLMVEHIRVANLLDTTAFGAPTLETASSDAPGEGYLEVDVSDALKSDLAQGRPSAQFRLRFNKPTNHDDRSNLALFSAADGYAPQLILHLRRP